MGEHAGGERVKTSYIESSHKDGIDYVGIAADETHRFEKENDQIGFYHFVIGALLKQMHSSIVTQKALFGMRME